MGRFKIPMGFIGIDGGGGAEFLDSDLADRECTPCNFGENIKRYSTYDSN